MGSRPTTHHQVVESYESLVARGLVTGHRSVFKFGTNQNQGASEEDLWSVGGTYPWPTSALPVRVQAGGNANDDAAGTGARSIIVQGLDDNFDEIEEEIALAGAAQSAQTNASFRRVNRAFVSDVGTYTGANTGAVTIETTAGSVLARLEANVGQTQLSMFTVPRNYRALVNRASMRVESGGNSKFIFYFRPNADIVAAPYQGRRVVDVYPNVNVGFDLVPQYPVLFDEKTDLWWAGDATGGSADISVNYSVLLVSYTSD